MSNSISVYAVSEDLSRGRAFKENLHPYRSGFERDRDRIIHSQAFRRLEGKTQVFTPGLDDNYRNRLTHTIEVSQIGRTIAKMLGLNESLTEAICLAHDLGHPPFGHTGEKILNDLMADFGGFEHNRQTLRTVDLLEHPYTNFSGLNLMYETRLGLAKHKSTYDKPEGEAFDEKNCSLEGQIADIADEIAYNCHDLEDGMRAGLISDTELESLEIFARAKAKINAQAINDKSVFRTRIAKTIIDELVSDCIQTSKETIIKANIKTVEDVYKYEGNLIGLSEENKNKLSELEKYLLKNFYLNEKVTENTERIRCWLKQIFDRLCSRPKAMPIHFQKLTDSEGVERTVCDYIAGMTDRFCLKMLDETKDK